MSPSILQNPGPGRAQQYVIAYSGHVSRIAFKVIVVVGVVVILSLPWVACVGGVWELPIDKCVSLKS